MKIAVDAIKKSVATQGYEEAELNVHVVNIENCIASLKCHGLKKPLWYSKEKIYYGGRS